MNNFKLVNQLGLVGQNFLFCGDNLTVMENLKNQFKEKIDLIYIDPPYNTGKKIGKYSDNFGSHQKWLEFMEPRLRLAKDFLTENGIIFISIDDNEEANLKLLCNKIFDEKNKVSTIIWQCKYTVANDKVGISMQTEYILVYAKNIKKIKLNNDPLRKEYINSNYKNIDNDPRGLWRGGIQLFKKKNPKSYTVISPTGKEWTKPWNYSEEQWKELEKNNLIYWGKNKDACPVKKVFLKDTKGIGVKNLWLGSDVGYTADGGNLLENMFGDRNVFGYPKPVSLIKRIIQVASKKDSIIMDFFAGSGTTGQAALEYNLIDNGTRKFIIITNNENNICDDLTFPRFQKINNGYLDLKNNKIKPIIVNLSYFKLNEDF